MHCDHSFLLHLGMDGASVNLAQVPLFEENPTFFDIGTCPLHTIRNGFSKGIRMTDFDIEQFIVDLNYSSNCPERITSSWKKLLSSHHNFL